MKKSNLLVATMLAASTGLTAFSQDIQNDSHAANPDTLVINLSKPAKPYALQGIIGKNMGLAFVLPAEIGNYPCEVHAGVTTNLPTSSMFNDTKGNLGYFRIGINTSPIPLPYVENTTACAGIDAYMGSNNKNVSAGFHAGLQRKLHSFKKNALSAFAEFHQLIGLNPQDKTIGFTGSGINFGLRIKADL